MGHDHFQNLSGELRMIAVKLDRLLRAIEPRFTVGPAWAGIGYKLGKNYSSVIVPGGDHVKLMVWRGTELLDDAGVLRGSGRNTRHLRFESARDVRPGVLRDLIGQQLALYARGVRYENAPADRAQAARLPDFVRARLLERDLLAAYRARPPYQRRDYLTWVSSPKREATRERRLEQMLDELDAGDVYMKMPWGPGRR